MEIDGIAPLVVFDWSSGGDLRRANGDPSGTTINGGSSMVATRLIAVKSTTRGKDKAMEAKVKPAQPPVSQSQDIDLVTIGKDGVEPQRQMVEHQEPQWMATPTDNANPIMLEDDGEMEMAAKVGRTSDNNGEKGVVANAPPTAAEGGNFNQFLMIKLI